MIGRSGRAAAALLSAVLLAGPLTGPASAEAKEGDWRAAASGLPDVGFGTERADIWQELAAMLGRYADNHGSKEETVIPEPADEDFVRVRDYIPDIGVELYYATDRNFTGRVIYDFTEAYLRYGTVKKLAQAQRALAERGCGLKIWDAFRPVSAQFRLWEVCPDSRYVADPNHGYSSHSRGNTVDVTLVDAWGDELPMPTGFDDFSPLADRDYSDVPDPEAVWNAGLLENVMSECGFTPYYGEWWHFSDSDSYAVGEEFEPPRENEIK